MSGPLAKVSAVERQAKRHASHFRELFITYEGRSEEIPLRPPDFSEQGMFIQTARRFPEGAVLKIRFRLVRSLYEVFARAEVRHCLPGVGIGVEFVENSAEARSSIREELRDSDVPSNNSR